MKIGNLSRNTKKSKYTRDKTLFNWKTMITQQKGKKKKRAKKLFHKNNKFKNKRKSLLSYHQSIGKSFNCNFKKKSLMKSTKTTNTLSKRLMDNNSNQKKVNTLPIIHLHWKDIITAVVVVLTQARTKMAPNLNQSSKILKTKQTQMILNAI